MIKHESTEQFVARLEREIEQKRREAAEYAAQAQPLLAAEEERLAALQREADAAAATLKQDNERLAQINADLEAAKRKADGERVAAIRDAVEASDGSVTLAARVKANREKYGAFGIGDGRKNDIRLAAAQLFEMLLGVEGTYELWTLMEPTFSAEMNLYGARWSAFFTPGETGELRVNVGVHGPQIIATPADLDRWISEQPAVFEKLPAAEVAS